MKTAFVRLFCAALALVMLASVAVVTASAAGAEIVNLYDESKSSIGIASAKDGDANGNQNYHSSAAIEVAEGDKITMGPILNGQSWCLMGFNADGGVTQNQIKPTAIPQTGVILNNAVILTYTVPKGTSYIRLVNSQMFYDSTLITKNHEFTKEEYFAYMDSKNINVDYLRPTDAKEALVNVFPVSDKTFAGRIDASDGKVAADAYRSCEFVTVQRGDTVYFASAAQSQGYHLSLQDANGKGTTNVKAPYMVLYEDLGKDYAIYAYRMRPGTGKVTVVIGTGCYEDGITLATINQPFTGETYRKMFNININVEPDKTSPLYGKTGLFMGDSISFGSGDTASYKTNSIGKAWAGRIAALTGLKATNASVGGAKASYISGDDSAKWLYNQHLAHTKTKFDIIVMQGGVNDARHNREVGTPQPVDSTSTELKKNLTTYIGGLQWTFHSVKEKFPDATLFFIANHRLDGHTTGQARNMAPYFDAAKQLCEMYGIHFIDLYNNKELNDKLETKTTKYLPDTLHLNGSGYDILTPYVIEALEAVLDPSTAPADTTTAAPDTTTAAPDTTTAAPADTTTAAPADTTTAAPDASADTTTAAPTTEAPKDDEGGCGGFVALGIIACVIPAAIVVCSKKKED